MTTKKWFAPVIDENTQILILGTCPWDVSIKEWKYYANPRNQFWKIISGLINEDLTDKDYNTKIQLLLKSGIWLYDVMEYCEREWSLDKDIENYKLNDIEGLLSQYPSVKTIWINGAKAYDTFVEANFDLSWVKVVKLPSSSSMNTKYDVNWKIKEWKKLLGL